MVGGGVGLGWFVGGCVWGCVGVCVGLCGFFCGGWGVCRGLWFYLVYADCGGCVVGYGCVGG